MLSDMCFYFCKREIQHKLAFPLAGMMLFQNALVPVQEGKLAHARFARGWSDVVQHEIILVQEGRLPCARFSPC
jgi:hypothetical protein